MKAWQVLIFEPGDDSQEGGIVKWLTKLHDLNAIRLIDLLLVMREPGGEVLAEASTGLSPADAQLERQIAEASLGLGPKFTPHRDDGAEPVAWRGRSAVLDAVDVEYLSTQVRPGRSRQAAVFELAWREGLQKAQASSDSVICDASLGLG